MNATVPADYSRDDPEGHAEEIADRLNLPGYGVGMLTAVDVGSRTVYAHSDDVEVAATVGLGTPTWAAAPDGHLRSDWYKVGTINLVVSLPVMMSDGALVNLVGTATEGKAQALLDLGVKATGTATDAVCVVCDPSRGINYEEAQYGGPRSTWGARVARAVHSAVLTGAEMWLSENSIPRREFESVT